MRVLLVTLLLAPLLLPAASAAVGPCVTAPGYLVGACWNPDAPKCLAGDGRCVIVCLTYVLGTRIYDACATGKGGGIQRP